MEDTVSLDISRHLPIWLPDIRTQSPPSYSRWRIQSSWFRKSWQVHCIGYKTTLPVTKCYMYLWIKYYVHAKIAWWSLYLICAPVPNTHDRQGSPQSQPRIVRIIDWSEHVIPVRSQCKAWAQVWTIVHSCIHRNIRLAHGIAKILPQAIVATNFYKTWKHIGVYSSWI